MDEYLKLVVDKEAEQGISGLRQRMDDDRDLCNLAKYVMLNSTGATVPDVVNVTLNKPALFAANVEASLNNSNEQVTIVTENSKLDKDHIADCVRAGFAQANKRLKYPLNAYFDQQMCRRGGGIARVLFRFEDGKIKADITPWDRRYYAGEIDSEGHGWGAYRTTRSKADIESEYSRVNLASKGLALLSNFELTSPSAQVIDFWNDDINAVYIDEKKAIEQPNTLGYPPICEQEVTLGSMLADSGDKKHHGESLFFLIRDVIPELNRLISIMQTLNMLALKGPGGWGSKDGQQQAPDYDEMMKSASVTQEEIGGGWRKYDFGDVKNAAIFAMNIMDNAIKQGSLEIVDVGNLPGPLSAVALIELGEGRDQIFMPRLGARGLLNQKIANMFLRQIIDSKQSQVQLGTKGRQRTFDISKLQGEYEIEFKYFVKSPKIDIARYSVAQVAERYLDEMSILKEVLQREDPEGDLARKHYDMAAQLSPMVRARRIIKSLSEMDDDDALLDAELLAMDLGMTLDKVLSGEMSTLQQPEDKQVGGAPLLSLMGGSGMSTSKQAAQLQKTPAEKEGT